MDRTIVDPTELALDTDQLHLNRNVLIGLSKLSAALIGTATQLNGLNCTPASPPGMSVSVAAGEIYQIKNVDDVPYGTLPADTTHQILKQGIILDAQNFSCPAPVTAGYSINYLIQVTLTESDSTATARAFYNTEDPNGVPPVFLSTSTTRIDLCDVRLKAGTGATTGTQTTPTPDAGFVGAWVVTVSYGQTIISATNIRLYPNAPFIPNIPSIVTANGIQNLIIGGDFGTNPWQRDISFPAVANQQFTADRFMWVDAASGAGVVTIAKSAIVPPVAQIGFLSTASVSITVTTADVSISSGEGYDFRYFVEGTDFTKIAQVPFTLSFLVYSNAPGVYCVGLKNSGYDRSYVSEFQIFKSNTWEKKSITVPASPTSGVWVYDETAAGLIISWVLAAGTDAQTSSLNSWINGDYFASQNQINFMGTVGNYLNLNLIQLEPGLIATPFKSRTAQQELALCQRYFEKSYDLNELPGFVSNKGASVCQVATSIDKIVGLSTPFKVTKRWDPSITLYSTATGNPNFVVVRNGVSEADVAVSSIEGTGMGATGYPNVGTTPSAGDILKAHWTANSEITH